MSIWKSASQHGTPSARSGNALASLDAGFEAVYTDFGRPSISPERLIRARLLQILFSIRSDRQLMEQMRYNPLLGWFVGLGIDDPVWVPTVFTKNRDRLLTADMSRKVMAAILAHREVAPLLSDDHFSVPFRQIALQSPAGQWMARS
jgi:transposase